VHDYGRGGAGVTLSWGCAIEAIELLSEVAPEGASVAVLGGGISGLSYALMAGRFGYSVHVYARDLPPNTTSDIAGGQWSPSLIGGPHDENVQRMLRRSYSGFDELVGPEWGVYRVPNYTTRGAKSSE
jgi:D-amino-acid oxidase